MKLFYERVVPLMTGDRKMTHKKVPRVGGPLLKLVSQDATAHASRTFTNHSGASGTDRKIKHRLLYRTSLLLLFTALGLLLGRAEILATFMPFALPAYAVTLQYRKNQSLWLAVGLTLGSATVISHGGDPLIVFTMLVSYRLLYELIKRVDSIDAYSLPMLVMMVDAGFRFGFSLPGHGFNYFALGVAVIEGLLTFILTYMFLQVPPLLVTSPHRSWRIEEAIAIVILFASVLSGLQGWQIHGVYVESVVARYAILLFAAAGGAGIGGAIGIVTGVILALGSSTFTPLIGVFGFAGVLAGLLHETKKPVVAIGFVIGSGILTLYVANNHLLLDEMIATLIAALGYFLTPSKLIQEGANLLPGTMRHVISQQEHVRRIKSLMTSRIQEIAMLFSQLSGSFTDGTGPLERQEIVNHQIVERTIHQICDHCHYQSRCWSKNAATTLQSMSDAVRILEINPDMAKESMPAALTSLCIKPDMLLGTMKNARELVIRHQFLIQQLRESRQIVADQLSGVAEIMLDLAQEIQMETGANHRQESAILKACIQLGLEVEDVEIISLEEGNVEIEVLQLRPSPHDEAGKLVAPLLSEILGETITVRSVEQYTDHAAQRIRLSSARQYQVLSGFASVAKDGTLKSGDFFSVMDLGNGKCAIALSDGMGNGERANQESSAAVNLVQQLLRAGFPEEVAIKTVNSALVLRSTDEMFATLDLAIVDLFTAKAEFLKVGSVPSFVRQGEKVMMVRGESLPIGILDEIEIQTKSVELQEGNLLVFMSDGIFEALSKLPEPEDWVCRQLERFATDDPQRLADWLLEAAVRVDGGMIRDDMTIVCARIERYKPGWATIRLPDMPSIRTKKDRKRLNKRMNAHQVSHQPTESVKRILGGL